MKKTNKKTEWQQQTKTICYPEARINQNWCKLWVAVLKHDLQKCNLNDKAEFTKQWCDKIRKENNQKGGKITIS